MVEQRQHREIDFAMAIVAGRIDQRGHTAAREENVSAPQIAVKKHCRRVGGDQVPQSRSEVLKSRSKRRADMGRVTEDAVERPELNPAFRPPVRYSDRAEAMVGIPAE